MSQMLQDIPVRIGQNYANRAGNLFTVVNTVEHQPRYIGNHCSRYEMNVTLVSLDSGKIYTATSYDGTAYSMLNHSNYIYTEN